MDIKNLPKVRGEYRFDFPLKQSTWFKVGGNAELFFKPEDEEDLAYFLRNIDDNIEVNILGNCSNVIIRDGGVEGVVIKLGRNFANISLENGKIRAGCGCLNYSVASFAQQNSRASLEFLVGIPGTIGGGIRMNAGAYGTEFKDVLESFRAIDFKGNFHEFDAKEILFKYRECSLPKDLIFLEAIFFSEDATPEQIKEKMSQINQQRQESQPIKEKTGGSTFANPDGKKAWELIDKVGLRGYQIGGAIFSEKHCNFLINKDNATSKDLEDLGELAREKVSQELGIDLKWEIKRIGKYA